MSYVSTRSYFPGMGEAVADRTVNRKIFTAEQMAVLPNYIQINPNDPRANKWRIAADLSGWALEESDTAPMQAADPITRSETWAEVGKRVASGNVGLTYEVGSADGYNEYIRMRNHLNAGTLLMSGRHLQHGDDRQKDRNLEVFTNCSTSITSFLMFLLLLNGSGVGRAYDDDLMLVDWREMPTTYVTIDADYPDRKNLEMDYFTGEMTPVIGDYFHTPEWFETQFTKGQIAGEGTVVHRHRVEDSREGWAKALEIMERMAFEKRPDDVLILDFSDVRPKGSPIKGMQNRPSSGPAPLMKALQRIAAVKLLNLTPWKSAMHVDHYAAECVLVGGARRAARMSTKSWRDLTIFEYIAIKKGGELWSSNNSVTIDDEFRSACIKVRNMLLCTAWSGYSADDLMAAGEITEIELHAWKVLNALAEASYFDGTGEPGLINQDRLTANDDGIEDYLDGLYAGSQKFQLDDKSVPMMRELARAMMGLRYTMITNPCGEITLLMLGAYCVIADVVPFHAANDDMAEDAFRSAVRALIRTNTMDSLYRREVLRTNRIGVGMTGLHEWIYDRFGFTWQDIVNEQKSMPMWQMLSRFKRAIVDEKIKYSKKLGVNVPHTDTTMKPAGTTSKLFGLTEGAHLPPKRWYLRWVQFRNDDPLIAEYEAKGYPIRRLITYEGTTIVGFPTEPTICQMDGGEWVTTAAEATPTEQYEFLRLLEKYWIVGVAEDGVTPLAESGNQISYTLKYDPKIVDFNHFLETLMEGQFSIRCCSVMPQEDGSAYEYLPEEPIDKAEYDRLMGLISSGIREEIGFEHVDCGAGACPIDFSEAAE